MVNCSNLCDQSHRNISFDALYDEPLEVDPDIVGKGVNILLSKVPKSLSHSYSR